MQKTRFEKVALVLPAGPWFEKVAAEAGALIAALGGSCSRPGPEFASAGRLGAACAELEQAQLVVADISGKNPNTMYLAGYAHGIGKRVLFLAQHGEDLPFNREKHEIIIYHANVDFLKESLEAFLRSGTLGGEPEAGRSAPQDDGRERFFELFGSIMAEHGAEHTGEIRMENEKTFLLINQDLDLAVVQHLARRAREMGLRIKLL